MVQVKDLAIVPMPLLRVFPYLIVEFDNGFFRLLIRIFKDQLIFKLTHVYKLDSALGLHQGGVHIPKRNVHEKGVHLLLVVHYFFRLVNVLIQANVHLLDNIVGKVLVCTKTLDHPNPIGVTFSEYV